MITEAVDSDDGLPQDVATAFVIPSASEVDLDNLISLMKRHIWWHVKAGPVAGDTARHERDVMGRFAAKHGSAITRLAQSLPPAGPPSPPPGGREHARAHTQTHTAHRAAVRSRRGRRW